VPNDAAAELRGFVARSMVAEDARWGMDAILSGQSGAMSGYLPLLLGHHWVRIAYEGARLLRLPDPRTGVPELAELLQDRYAAITARGRHASKLTDDTKKGYDQVLGELEALLRSHTAQLAGKARRWLRWAERDRGLYLLGSKVAGASLPAAYRLGLEIADGGRIAGQDIRAVSEEWGGTMAVLGAAAGDSSAPAATIDWRRVSRMGYRDRLASRYFAERFEPDFTVGLKALLLLIEGDLNTSLLLLPCAETGHELAVFRARTVTLYHALTALQRVKQRYADSDGTGLRTLRTILQDPPVRRLTSKEGRLVRNLCVHYAISDPGIRPDASRHMFGLVESVFPGNTWEAFNADVVTTASRVADCLNSWRPQMRTSRDSR
jgi:hypothetical protein